MENSHKMSENVEIDLMELMWKVLIQWRLMIPVALIFGILVTGVMYARSLSSYRQAETAVVTEESLSENLTEEEIDLVSETIQLRQQLQQLTDYQENSVLMKLNPYQTHTLNIHYLITSDNMDLTDSCKDLYKTFFMSDAILTTIGNSFDEDIQAEYLAELVSNGSPAEISNPAGIIESAGGVITLSIILPQEIDTKPLLEAIDGQVAQYTDQIRPQIGNHTISRFFTEETTRVNDNVLAKQTTINSSRQQITSRISTNETAFSDEQQALYDYLQNEPSQEDDFSPSIQPEEEPVSSPTISVRYFALGVLVGIFLFCLYVLLTEILRPRVQGAADIENAVGIRNLGEIREYRQESAFGRFRYDRNLYRLHHKKVLNTAHQSRQISDLLISVCRKKKFSEANLIALNPLNEADDVYLENIIKRADENDIILHPPISYSIDEEGALPDISASKGIVLVLLSDRTLYRDIDAMLTACRDFEIPIIGTIFLDC